MIDLFNLRREQYLQIYNHKTKNIFIISSIYGLNSLGFLVWTTNVFSKIIHLQEFDILRIHEKVRSF